MTSSRTKQLAALVTAAAFASAGGAVYWRFADLPLTLSSAAVSMLALLIAIRVTPSKLAQIGYALGNGYVGLMICNMRGDPLHINRTAEQLLRTERSTLSRLHISEICGEGLWDLLQEKAFALHRGDSIRLEYEKKVAGRQRHFSAQVKLILGFLGIRKWYLLQFEDRTRQVISERRLQETTDQMRRLFAHSSDMVFVLTPKLKISFVNETAAKVLDTAVSLFLDTPIYHYMAEPERRPFMQAVAKLTDDTRSEISVGEFEFCGNTCTRLDARLVKLPGSGYALVGVPTLGVKHLEEQRAGFERFAKVFHNSPDAILIVREEDSVILDFNEGFQRLLGYTREQVIGESGVESSFWQSANDREQVIQRLKKAREITDHETTLRTADGRLVHVEISLRYIDVDQTLCILCIGRDITKRISAEAALVETEEKFAKVFNESPDGIVIFRQADNTISDLNDAFVLRSGFRREDIEEASLDEFLRQVASDTDELNDYLSKGRSFTNLDITFITRHKSPVPTLVSGELLELGGEPHMMLIVKDVTALRETEEQLKGSESRFRGIFENAPIGIMLMDPAGVVFQANHTAAELLESNQDKLNGMHISRVVPQEERQALKDALAGLLETPGLTYRAEQRLVCESGLECWSKMNVVLQRDSAGEPAYYIVQMADISDIKSGQQQMEQLAFYDTLTNLANRRLFHDRLDSAIERCQRHGRSGALLYLDLDNFKRVNDTLGHQTGDHLLQEVAQRLRRCVRQEDTVGRGGGDEFTIVLNEITSASDAGLVAQKILNHLREPIEIDGHPMIVTTSLGITLFPEDGAEANVLMGNADLAMYKAKERGRNNFQFYSDDLNANAAKRLRTEYEIRSAIDDGEFELYYQPKVSLTTGQVVGVETLIRWNHPQRGILAPDEFISIAEDTGSIIDIGTWVIEEACRSCRALSAMIGDTITVAINISPRQFRDPNLINTIRRGLREQQLEADALELEITETMLMQDVEAALTTLKKLSELGVNLAIDDFGTGYSSLNYLRRFPIDTVKIDRSFVMDLPQNTDDLAITRAVIAMAHQLKMSVVAEGVENREQLKFLAEENCEYAQGFYFSKPVPMDEIIKLIRDRNQKAGPQMAITS